MLKDAPAYGETLPNLALMVQDLQPYSNVLFLLSAQFPPPFWTYLSPSPPAAPLSHLSLLRCLQGLYKAPWEVSCSPLRLLQQSFLFLSASGALTDEDVITVTSLQALTPCCVNPVGCKTSVMCCRVGSLE